MTQDFAKELFTEMLKGRVSFEHKPKPSATSAERNLIWEIAQ